MNAGHRYPRRVRAQWRIVELEDDLMIVEAYQNSSRNPYSKEGLALLAKLIRSTISRLKRANRL